MNTKTLLTLILSVAVLGLIGFFILWKGTDNKTALAGDKAQNILAQATQAADAQPTEQEVSNLYQRVYSTCVPVNEWEEKILSLGGRPGVTASGGVQCGYHDYDACLEWMKGKTECDQYRKVAGDHFVSFKKTDGKLIAPSQLQTAEEYMMYGTLTTFNSATGKDEQQKPIISFERRESGWIAAHGLWYEYNGPELTIPR